jgi:ribosomal protein L11 methylase PrmA
LTDGIVGGSFRDPSGFVYRSGGVLLRQVNPTAAADYDALRASGLYDALTERGWLVSHEEVPNPEGSGAYRTLRPVEVPYVSYPYEWCFSQLKEAARLTLDLQMEALTHGLSLKDASAYNVQFVGRRPVHIDTLSFTRYEDGAPWVAYRQFCQQFLGPLALMTYTDARARHLLVHYLDGLPIDLVSRLLPARTRLRYGLLAHIHLHAASQRRHQDSGARARPATIPRLSKSALVALVRSLKGAVEACTGPAGATEWTDYYDATSYSAEAMEAKAQIVRRLVDAVAGRGGLLHDLGANTGRFSRLLAGPGRYVVAHDIDERAVDRHYRSLQSDGLDDILPLCLDLANPSPGTGWAHEERLAAAERMAGGTVIALALVHHLAIGLNVPLPRIVAFLARIARAAVVEFVPKGDPQVARLLATRADVFPDYTLDAFERALSASYTIVERAQVPGTVRTVIAARALE